MPGFIHWQNENAYDGKNNVDLAKKCSVALEPGFKVNQDIPGKETNKGASL